MAEPLRQDVETADGERIAAQFFAPSGAPSAAVLVVPAMGVPQTYYAEFGRWLASQGYLAATFDFRGCGLSRRRPLREVEADILTWSRVDCAAVLEALAARAGERPIYWVGHSLGGQILPFVPNLARVAKAITVATGSGYWRENAAGLRRVSWWLWFVAVPVAVRLFGYFPGRRLRKVGDLPRGVIEQWRRWCLDPDYAVGAEGEAVGRAYAAVRTPIVSLSFTDDEYMSARNIEAIHAQYTGAPLRMKRIAPAQVGADRIGHFGFFRPRFRDSLWRAHLLPELGGAPSAG